MVKTRFRCSGRKITQTNNVCMVVGAMLALLVALQAECCVMYSGGKC